MQAPPFKLETYKGPATRHECPGCGHKRRFARYVDTETGQHLHPSVGKCDRLDKCGYHYPPRQYFMDNNISHGAPKFVPPPKPRPPAPKEYFPAGVLAHLQANDRAANSFLAGVLNCVPDLPAGVLHRVADLYGLGTVKSGKFAGACAFPFIDRAGRVHFVQVKQFDERCKTTATNAAHYLLKDLPAYRGWFARYDSQEGKIGCFFGANLLDQYPNNPVALVESPKNAFVGSLFFGHPADGPDNYLWLATGSASTFTLGRARELQGRKVAAFPDRGAYAIWEAAIGKLRREMPGTVFSLNDYLETDGAKRECPTDGADIADLLFLRSWLEFTGGASTGPQPAPTAKATPATSPADTTEPLPLPPAIAPAPEPTPTIGHGDYVAGLYMEAGRLMAPGGYPASWDTCAPYLAQETRHFAALAAKNPLVLDLVRGLGLEVSASGAQLPPREQAPKDSWAVEVEGLAKWFAGAVLPVGPVSLGGGGTVTDCRKFIDAHLEIVRANGGKATFLPYFERLRELRAVLGG